MTHVFDALPLAAEPQRLRGAMASPYAAVKLGVVILARPAAAGDGVARELGRFGI